MTCSELRPIYPNLSIIYLNLHQYYIYSKRIAGLIISNLNMVCNINRLQGLMSDNILYVNPKVSKSELN